MEFVTHNSNVEQLADAMRGVHGKHVSKDFSFLYLGQGVLGVADSTDILDRHVGVAHHEWLRLGDRVWFAICK
jgi:hypothetical protein